MPENSYAMSPLLQSAQPLFAYRTWRIVDGQLRSPHDAAVWTAAGLTAECRPRNAEDFVRDGHVAPSPSCGCGISATAEPDMDICGTDATSVVGLVRLWGRVVLQRGTLRAEHADVVMLGAYVQWSRRQRVAAAQVAEQIGCRLVALETIGEHAVELFGRPAVELDEGTRDALRATAPAIVQVAGPRKRFVRAR